MARTETGKQLFTADEAAERLSISPWTMRHWIAQRRVDVVRLSTKCVRVPGAEIDRLIAEATVPARAAS